VRPVLIAGFGWMDRRLFSDPVWTAEVISRPVGWS